MKIKNFGIDLGTAYTLGYVQGCGIYPGPQVQQSTSELAPSAERKLSDFPQPIRSVVMRNRLDGKIVAIGSKAYSFTGRVPRHLRIDRAVVNGQIQDTTVMLALLDEVLRQSHPNLSIEKNEFLEPDLVVVPVSCNTQPLHYQVMRIAIMEHFMPAFMSQKPIFGRFSDAPDGIETRYPGRIVMVSQPACALVGAGLNYKDNKARLVIDIGGGTTNVAIICGNEVVFHGSIPIGGDLMDEAIQAHVAKAHDMGIGILDAENIKMKLGTAVEPQSPELSVGSIDGKCLKTGQPKRTKITNMEIFQCLAPIFESIQEAIQSKLATCSQDQILSDIKKNGAILTGGGSLISKSDAYFRNKFSYTVRRVQNPLYSVILGVEKMIEDPAILDYYDLKNIQQPGDNEVETWSQDQPTNVPTPEVAIETSEPSTPTRRTH